MCSRKRQSVDDDDDDDDDSRSYVRQLVIRPGKQFSFRSRRNADIRWQLHIGAGREFQVDGPATAKLRGPYRASLWLEQQDHHVQLSAGDDDQRYQRPVGQNGKKWWVLTFGILTVVHLKRRLNNDDFNFQFSYFIIQWLIWDMHTLASTLITYFWLQSYFLWQAVFTFNPYLQISAINYRYL